MPSFIDEVKLGGAGKGERVALPEGKYTDLELVSYIQKTSGPSKSDAELYRHAFLVASEGTDGTAFFDLRVKSFWLHPPTTALAFNAVDKAIANGEATEEEIGSVESLLREIVKRKVEAANTPDEAVEEATTKGYENLLTQIRIAIGTIFRLQDWAGTPRSLDVDIPALVGTKFHGQVVAGTNGQSELKSVYTKSAKTGAVTGA